MLQHAAAAALALAVRVDGHASMLMPAPRNAIDSELPNVDWGNGTNHTGVIEPAAARDSSSRGAGDAPCLDARRGRRHASTRVEEHA